MKKSIIISLISLFTIGISYSAYSQNEYSLGYSKNIMLDYYKWVYKNGNGLVFKYSHEVDDFGVNYASFGFSMGYSRFKKRADTLFFLVPPEEYGWISYTDNLTFSLMAQYNYHIGLTNKLEMKLGFEIGYYFVMFSSTESGPGYLSTGGSVGSKGGIVPKIGFSYLISKTFGVLVEIQYNILIPMKSENSNSNSIYIASEDREFNYHYTLSFGGFIRI